MKDKKINDSGLKEVLRPHKMDETECDFINPSGEGVEPVSLYENSEEDDWWKEEPISHKKGQIILQGDL